MKNEIGVGYLPLSNYLEKVDVTNFKRNQSGFNYAVEHSICDAMCDLGRSWLQGIKDTNMLTLEQINKLLELNDKIGNGYKTDKISNEIQECNPNSLKYIYMGLLVIKQLKLNKFNDFVEIGGGYGGQCLILLKLFELFDIDIKNYILIDLDNVSRFQEKYLTAHGVNSKCKFLTYGEYSEYDWDSNNYLFSCYSFNEVMPKVRQNYYDNLFPYISHGSFIWPTTQSKFERDHQTLSLGKTGRFIYF